jgi:hypothetical protein
MHGGYIDYNVCKVCMYVCMYIMYCLVCIVLLCQAASAQATSCLRKARYTGSHIIIAVINANYLLNKKELLILGILHEGCYYQLV